MKTLSHILIINMVQSLVIKINVSYDICYYYIKYYLYGKSLLLVTTLFFVFFAVIAPPNSMETLNILSLIANVLKMLPCK